MDISPAVPANEPRVIIIPEVGTEVNVSCARPAIFPSAFWALPVALLFLVAHFGWLAACHVATAVSPDSHDYLLTGRLMAEQRTASLEVTSPLTFVSPQWFPASDARYHSIHDLGFPAVLAGVRTWVSGDAESWVNPLLVSLTLLGFFLWCRRHADAWLALAGTVCLASLPALNQAAGYGDSHPLSAFCLVWAVFLVDRLSLVRALLGGVLLGMIPAVRSADVLMAALVGAVCVGRILIASRTNPQQRWISILLLVLGAAVPLSMVMIHNAACYGAPWKSAYSAFGGDDLFGMKYLRRNAGNMLRLFTAGNHCWVLWFGLASMVLLLLRRQKLGLLALVMAAVLGNLAVYLPFYWPVDINDDRFFIAVYVMMTAAIVLGWQSMALARRRITYGIAGFVTVITIVIGAPVSQKRMDELSLRDQVLREMMTLIKDKVPKGAVIIADYAVAQEIDAEGGWRVVDLGRFIPPTLRGLHRRPDNQAKSVSRKNLIADNWLISLNRMPPDVFDQMALPELRSFAKGNPIYMLTLPQEWEALSRRWTGNWSVVGGFSLPNEQSKSQTTASTDPNQSLTEAIHPNDPGKFFDLRFNGDSLDLVKANLQ